MPVRYASYVRRFGLLAIAGAAALLLLGLIRSWEGSAKQHRQDSAVFEPLKTRTLTDDNLVDAMAELPVRDRLRRVQWDHGILALDLTADDPLRTGEDARELIAFAFADKQNVAQVLIRVFNGNNGENKLLMGLETRRTDWTEKELAGLKPEDLASMPDSTPKVRLYVTPMGERWRGNLAN